MSGLSFVGNSLTMKRKLVGGSGTSCSDGTSGCVYSPEDELKPLEAEDRRVDFYGHSLDDCEWTR